MTKSEAREMGISDARANMTEVIAEVRLLGTPVVLTRRDKPQAVLVSVAWFEQAKTHRRVAEAALKVLAEGSDRDAALQRLSEVVDQVQQSD